MKSIGIIGCGVSGAAFFVNFVHNYKENESCEKLSITLIDMIEVDGKGVAYRTPHFCNLLNTPSTTTGLLFGNKKHFFNWMQLHNKKLLEKYGSFSLIYPPRSLYGDYVEYTLNEHVEIAKNSGIKVVFMKNKAVDVKRKNQGYEVAYLSENKSYFDYLILSTGGFKSSNFAHLNGIENFYSSPYNDEFPKKIANTDNVIILGTRLSAIDAAIMLKENNHSGNIYLLSRKGGLPRVQGKLKDRPRKFLTSEYIHSKANLALGEIIEMIRKEVLQCEGVDVRKMHRTMKMGTPQSVLRGEIIKSKKTRPWQNILYTENHLFNCMWRKLSIKDKKKLITKYMDYFSIYRATMPLVNAEKLHELMKDKILHVKSDFNVILFEDDKNEFVATIKNNEPIRAKHLIDATGLSYDINKTHSLLYKNTLKHGIISSNCFGGANLNGISYETINKNDRANSGLYLLGGLCHGIDFGTSLVEYIVTSSISACNDLLEKITAHG